jgi:hypothetical protein
MTEPPHSDDEDDEFRELEEFLNSEYFAELSDDLLLDKVGRGEDDRTIYDEFDEVEDQLENDLHDIKEQTEDEPVPELVSVDEAKKILAEAKKKHDEKKTAERCAESQGEDNVTISDDAQRIATIGNDEEAAGAIQAAKTDLDAAQTALGQVGEALSAAVQKIQAAAEKVASQSAEAGGLLGGAEGEAIQGQGQTISEQCNNANQHVGQVDLGAVEASLQQTNLDGVGQQIQALYQAIKDAASRHQG